MMAIEAAPVPSPQVIAATTATNGIAATNGSGAPLLRKLA